MISVDDALRIHNLLVEQFGGSLGIRDRNGLALKRPFSTFGDQELYPDSESKAAALIESLISNHPFIDGNKRTGYVLMRLLLMNEDKDVRATEEEKYDFVIGIASGKLKFKQILEWLRSNTREKIV